jgi:hypothetical protein
MLIDLLVEGFTEGDYVPLIRNFDTAVVFISAEPKLHVFEEVEAGPVALSRSSTTGEAIFAPG